MSGEISIERWPDRKRTWDVVRDGVRLGLVKRIENSPYRRNGYVARFGAFELYEVQRPKGPPFYVARHPLYSVPVPTLREAADLLVRWHAGYRA